MKKTYLVEVCETEEHPCEALHGGTYKYTLTDQELVEFFGNLMVEHDYRKLGRHCDSWYAEWDNGPYSYTSTVTVSEA